MHSEDQLRWNQKYAESPSSWLEADDFLISMYEEFLKDAQPGLALDVAGGAGRNALWLVQRGWRVKLIDVSDVALGLAQEKFASSRCKGHLETAIVDLNSVYELGDAQFDLITVFYFLRRELFPAVVRALKPGGTLIYRTYTIDRMKVPGGPSDPRYLLQPNELLHAFGDLRVLHYHEMLAGKAAAELVARK